MRKLILLFVVTVFVSCNSKKLEGVYLYEEEEPSDIMDIGKGIGCSMVGQFEFKNGQCYMKFLGQERNVDYDIENGIIHLGTNITGNTAAEIRLIDDNTIEYLGCKFKKEGSPN